MSALPAADEHRIRLTLHYDGSGFAGWQVQPGERTVQGELEAALHRLTSREIRVIAAGRTDAGVHATGQVVGAAVPQRWTAAELRRALNAVLPRDVWISNARIAAPEFHARYDAVARGYVYRLGTADVARSPFMRRWCWPLGQPVSLAALNDAAARFLGEHSFRSFARTGQPERGEMCTVTAAEWRDAPIGVGRGKWADAVAATPPGPLAEAVPGLLTFHVVANRFLHHMVRYMVGTMVDVARRRRPADEINAMLDGAEGLETSPPAPPEGLYLTRVYYDNDETDPDEILP